MTEHERRWARLIEAARRFPTSKRPPVDPAWVERVARQGLGARAAPDVRAPERLAWAGLTGLAAAAVTLVLLSPGPLTSAASALASGVVSLPRSVPHAPRLPAAPVVRSPALPSPESALAAVTRLPELTLDLPFTSRRTETP